MNQTINNERVDMTSEYIGAYDKVYIGREEAFEIMLERHIEELPRKNREIVTVKCNVEKLSLGQTWDDVLGKDENGYYIGKL